MIAVVAQPNTTADGLLADQIREQLADTKRASLKHLLVAVKSGEVTLQGCVASFHERQIAIQACRLMAGVSRLIDAMEVAVAY